MKRVPYHLQIALRGRPHKPAAIALSRPDGTEEEVKVIKIGRRREGRHMVELMVSKELHAAIKDGHVPAASITYADG